MWKFKSKHLDRQYSKTDSDLEDEDYRKVVVMRRQPRRHSHQNNRYSLFNLAPSGLRKSWRSFSPFRNEHRSRESVQPDEFDDVISRQLHRLTITQFSLSSSSKLSSFHQMSCTIQCINMLGQYMQSHNLMGKFILMLRGNLLLFEVNNEVYRTIVLMLTLLNVLGGVYYTARMCVFVGKSMQDTVDIISTIICTIDDHIDEAKPITLAWLQSPDTLPHTCSVSLPFSYSILKTRALLIISLLVSQIHIQVVCTFILLRFPFSRNLNFTNCANLNATSLEGVAHPDLCKHTHL